MKCRFSGDIGICKVTTSAADMMSSIGHHFVFGSGFPSISAADGIEALYSINQICQGTNLPTIPRECLRGIVQRPTLDLLGISTSTQKSTSTQPAALLEDDEH